VALMCGDPSVGISAISNLNSLRNCNPYAPPREKPEEKLSRLLLTAADVRISPTVLKLFIAAHWNKISKLAHEIHDQVNP
jgi:hypothetical protein